jgi:hypothetical protein
MTEAPPIPEWVAGFLNRRFDVEHQLRLLEKGERGPIEPDEARQLADRLSVPEQFMGRREPAPHDVAEQIAKAIEPHDTNTTSARHRALKWAAEVARTMFAPPDLPPESQDTSNE